MIDRFFAVISLLLLAGFCSVLVVYVERLDLAIVVTLVLLMAAFDFFRETVLLPYKARAKVQSAKQRDQI